MFGITKEQVLDAHKFRSACRHYDSERKISSEDFTYLLELARLSPSSVGAEPWHFLVVQNRAVREKLKPFSWGMAAQLDTCSHLVIFLAKKKTQPTIPRFCVPAWRSAASMTNKWPKLLPCMNISKSTTSRFTATTALCWIGRANKPISHWPIMMSGAAMIGIDSCPAEGLDYREVNRILAQEGAFDPEEWAVSVACTFGYRARDISRKYRKPMDEIVTWME